jgi:phosphoribosylaminoimidazole-succinocarboxamide synthase
MDNNLINEDNIIDIIIKMMEKTEQFINKTGIEKKVIVLDNIKSIIGEESYNRYKYLISSTIDFIIQVSKGRKINLNNFKKKFCCISIK